MLMHHQKWKETNPKMASSALYQVQTSFSMAFRSTSIEWVPIALFINFFCRFLQSTLILSVVSFVLQNNIVGIVSDRCYFMG